MRTILYSLRDEKNRTELSIDLTGRVIDENLHSLTVELPTGTVCLQKENWLNRDRVYDDGKVFFLVANKLRNTDHVLKTLIRYAIQKLDTRLAHIEVYRNRLNKELAVSI